MKIFEALRPTTAEIMTTEISTKEISQAHRLATGLSTYLGTHRAEISSPLLTVITTRPEVTTQWDKVAGRAYCTFEVTIDLGLKTHYQFDNPTARASESHDPGQVSCEMFSLSDTRELQQIVVLVTQSFQTEYWQPLHPASVETYQLWPENRESREPQTIPVEHRFHFDFVPHHGELPSRNVFQKALIRVVPAKLR